MRKILLQKLRIIFFLKFTHNESIKWFISDAVVKIIMHWDVDTWSKVSFKIFDDQTHPQKTHVRLLTCAKTIIFKVCMKFSTKLVSLPHTNRFFVDYCWRTFHWAALDSCLLMLLVFLLYYLTANFLCGKTIGPKIFYVKRKFSSRVKLKTKSALIKIQFLSVG